MSYQSEEAKEIAKEAKHFTGKVDTSDKFLNLERNRTYSFNIGGTWTEVQFGIYVYKNGFITGFCNPMDMKYSMTSVNPLRFRKQE